MHLVAPSNTYLLRHVSALLDSEPTEVSAFAVLVGGQRRLRPDLKDGGEGTDEALAVHGGYLNVVEVVRLQVGHHLGVPRVFHGHVRGQLAVAEDENLRMRKERKVARSECSLCAVDDAKSISNLKKSYEKGREGGRECL